MLGKIIINDQCIFSLVHKVLLGVEKTKIKQFQYDMLQMFEAEHPEIGQEIEEKKVLTEELIDKIVETAKEFKKSRC